MCNTDVNRLKWKICVNQLLTPQFLIRTFIQIQQQQFNYLIFG